MIYALTDCPRSWLINEITHIDPDQVQTRAELSRALSTLRTAAGLTVRDLAGRLDIPSATLGGYLSGRHLPSPSQLPTYKSLLAECGLTDDDQLEPWVRALDRVRGTSHGKRSPAGPAPYRGLEPFEPEDAAMFFGREAETEQILARLTSLREQGERGRATLFVIGPSGSGKSSLLRAGVVPAIRAGALDVSDEPGWRCRIATPGAELLTATSGDGPCVLVVDQFEELFTSCPAQARRELLARLAELDPRRCLIVAGMRADFYPLAAAEPELVEPLQNSQQLVRPLTRDGLRSVIVEPARASGAEVAAELVELVLSELAPRSVGPLAHDPGALPMLSHALLETWKRARHRKLTVADYQASGGIRGAVQQTAEALYAQLSPDEQQVTRHVFIRLVNFDEDRITARRRLPRAELRALVEDAERRGIDLNAILDEFVAQRLVTAEADTVMLSHETLLSAWPRLHEWLDEDRAGLRLQRRLIELANSWRESGRDDGLLLRGGQLAAATEWVDDPQNRAALNRTERELVDASIASEQHRRQAERRRTRTLQRLLGAVAVLAVVTAALSGYSLRARASANSQRAAANDARDQALSREIAGEVPQVRAYDPSLASQLAVAAYRISPTLQARSALIDTTASASVTRILGASGPTAAAVDPTGRILAIAQADTGAVRLYTMRSGQVPRAVGTVPGRSNQLYGLAFSPDGHVLATAGSDGRVQLWDISRAAHPSALATNLTHFGAAALAITYSPDGSTLVATGSKPAVLRWNVSDPAHPVALPAPKGMPGGIDGGSATFSADGTILAIGGSDGNVRLWRAGAATPSVIALTSSGITALSFSPDGHILAAASKNGNVYLWDAQSRLPRQLHAPLNGFQSWATTVAFTPDGRTLFAGSSDKSVRGWDTQTWAQVADLKVPGPSSALQITPDGGTLLASSAEGSVQLWPYEQVVVPELSGTGFTVTYGADGRLAQTGTAGALGDVALWRAAGADLEPGSEIVPPKAFGPGDGASAISPDGKLLAIGSVSGNVELWNVSTPSEPRLIKQGFAAASKLIESLAFSRDDTLLAVGSDDGAVHLWNVSSPSAPVSVERLDTGGISGEAISVTFSPDASLLAAASTNDKVYVWRLHSGQPPTPLGPLGGFGNYAWAVTFSPDGRTLAASSADLSTLMWDVSGTGVPVRIGPPLTGPTDYATSVSFSPDSKTLAIGSSDSTMRLWNVADRAHPKLTAILRAETGGINSGAFNPKGPYLSAVGGGHRLVTWDIDARAAQTDICQYAGSAITRSEWAQYVPGAAYQPPCA